MSLTTTACLAARIKGATLFKLKKYFFIYGRLKCKRLYFPASGLDSVPLPKRWTFN